jgi:hypothetical protein
LSPLWQDFSSEIFSPVHDQLYITRYISLLSPDSAVDGIIVAQQGIWWEFTGSGAVGAGGGILVGAADANVTHAILRRWNLRFGAIECNANALNFGEDMLRAALKACGDGFTFGTLSSIGVCEKV